jgi:hypothetical protein
MNAGVYEACSIKRSRRTKADMADLRRKIVRTISRTERAMTVRQLFYQLVGQGAVPKTEAAYNQVVVRVCGEMREDGTLPWSWITDSSRWIRKPRSHNSLEAAIEHTAATYRRDLWSNQNAYVEVWCEKEALAGVLYPITSQFDVPLMIVKGFCSKGFAHDAAMNILQEDKPAFIYYCGDHDPSGLKVSEDLEGKLARYTNHKADLHFERLAVTEAQIRKYALPTRPTKREGNTHAKNFVGDSVELDALPVDVLQALIRGAIEQHIDQHQFAITKAAEESERELLKGLV